MEVETRTFPNGLLEKNKVGNSSFRSLVDYTLRSAVTMNNTVHYRSLLMPYRFFCGGVVLSRYLAQLL